MLIQTKIAHIVAEIDIHHHQLGIGIGKAGKDIFFIN